MWVLAWSRLLVYSTDDALIAEATYGASRRIFLLMVCSLNGDLRVGASLVKVVSLLDGWSSDCGRHIRRFALYIF